MIPHYNWYFTANPKIKYYTGCSIEKSISLNRCAFVEHPVLYFYNRQENSNHSLQFNKKISYLSLKIRKIDEGDIYSQ